MQAHTAGIEQQQHAIGMGVRRAAQQAGQLGAMHLTHAAAHEFTLLSGYQHVFAVQASLADDDAIVEGGRLVQLRQMRADGALGWAEKFAERSCNKQPDDARAGIGFVIAGALCERHGWPPASRVSTAWSRRRLTTAGVAPASLIDTRTSRRG